MFKVVVTQAAKEGSAVSDDNQLLDNLVDLWKSHNERSLRVRMETGRLLNARLGSPTERQPRGQRVLRQAADKLHTAQSELSRMRWFAYFSKDGESFWGEEDPDKRTWNSFKKILPGLNAARKGSEKRLRFSGDKTRSAVVNGLFRSLDSATSKLRADNFTVDETKRELLIEKLRGFVSAVSDSTGICLRLETEDELSLAGA